MKHICAFLGGALVGAAAALLLAPQKGEDLRGQIREILRRKGLIKDGCGEEVIVEQIAAEIEAGAEE